MTEEEKQILREKIYHRASQGGYFSARVELVYDALEETWAAGHFDAKQHHCNPYGIVHGGAYYALMDQLTGMAVAFCGYAGVTIDSSVNYIRSARVGERVLCRVDRIHMGRSIAVFEAKCTGEDGALQATGTFHLFLRGEIESLLQNG